MVDVLDAQSDLYNSQRNKSRAQYAYVLNTLRLKQFAGTLSPIDLRKINAWLDDSVIVRTNIR